MSLNEHFRTDGTPKNSYDICTASRVVEDLRLEGEDVDVYQCSFCNGLHIGHARN